MSATDTIKSSRASKPSARGESHAASTPDIVLNTVDTLTALRSTLIGYGKMSDETLQEISTGILPEIVVQNAVQDTVKNIEACNGTIQRLSTYPEMRSAIDILLEGDFSRGDIAHAASSILQVKEQLKKAERFMRAQVTEQQRNSRGPTKNDGKPLPPSTQNASWEELKHATAEYVMVGRHLKELRDRKPKLRFGFLKAGKEWNDIEKQEKILAAMERTLHTIAGDVIVERQAKGEIPRMSVGEAWRSIWKHGIGTGETVRTQRLVDDAIDHVLQEKAEPNRSMLPDAPEPHEEPVILHEETSPEEFIDEEEFLPTELNATSLSKPVYDPMERYTEKQQEYIKLIQTALPNILTDFPIMRIYAKPMNEKYGTGIQVSLQAPGKDGRCDKPVASLFLKEDTGEIVLWTDGTGKIVLRKPQTSPRIEIFKKELADCGQDGCSALAQFETLKKRMPNLTLENQERMLKEQIERIRESQKKIEEEQKAIRTQAEVREMWEAKRGQDAIDRQKSFDEAWTTPVSDAPVPEAEEVAALQELRYLSEDPTRNEKAPLIRYQKVPEHFVAGSVAAHLPETNGSTDTFDRLERHGINPDDPFSRRMKDMPRMNLPSIVPEVPDETLTDPTIAEKLRHTLVRRAQDLRIKNERDNASLHAKWQEENIRRHADVRDALVKKAQQDPTNRKQALQIIKRKRGLSRFLSTIAEADIDAFIAESILPEEVDAYIAAEETAQMVLSQKNARRPGDHPTAVRSPFAEWAASMGTKKMNVPLVTSEEAEQERMIKEAKEKEMDAAYDRHTELQRDRHALEWQNAVVRPSSVKAGGGTAEDWDDERIERELATAEEAPDVPGHTKTRGRSDAEKAFTVMVEEEPAEQRAAHIAEYHKRLVFFTEEPFRLIKQVQDEREKMVQPGFLSRMFRRAKPNPAYDALVQQLKESEDLAVHAAVVLYLERGTGGATDAESRFDAIEQCAVQNRIAFSDEALDGTKRQKIEEAYRAFFTVHRQAVLQALRKAEDKQQSFRNETKKWAQQYLMDGKETDMSAAGLRVMAVEKRTDTLAEDCPTAVDRHFAKLHDQMQQSAPLVALHKRIEIFAGSTPGLEPSNVQELLAAFRQAHPEIQFPATLSTTLFDLNKQVTEIVRELQAGKMARAHVVEWLQWLTTKYDVIVPNGKDVPAVKGGKQFVVTLDHVQQAFLGALDHRSDHFDTYAQAAYRKYPALKAGMDHIFRSWIDAYLTDHKEKRATEQEAQKKENEPAPFEENGQHKILDRSSFSGKLPTVQQRIPNGSHVPPESNGNTVNGYSSERTVEDIRTLLEQERKRLQKSETILHRYERSGHIKTSLGYRNAGLMARDTLEGRKVDSLENHGLPRELEDALFEYPRIRDTIKELENQLADRSEKAGV